MLGTHMFTNYPQLMKFLSGLGLFHMDLTLDRIQEAVQILKLERLPFLMVQIVGTNGKGSTATFLDSLARAHGVRTGLFTSPHFVSPRERILCSGKPLTKELWVKFSNDIHAQCPHLTYFEFLTVLAVYAFVQCDVELVILEAGLGGKFDATSAINRDIVCISPISMDHEAVLGDSLKAIAKDKSAVMGSGMNVYYAPQHPEVMEVLQNTAQTKGARLRAASVDSLPTNIQLGLMGPHQSGNALLALAAWQDVAKRIKCNVDESAIGRGLAKAFIPGRLQSIACLENELPGQILLDGAHNEQGLQVLMDALSKCNQLPSIIIFSCMADKNMQAMLPKLKQLRKLCHNCPLIIVGLQNNERALSLEQRLALAQCFDDERVIALDSMKQALDYANKIVPSEGTASACVLICGSLYLLGEFFEMYPHYLYADNHCKV